MVTVLTCELNFYEIQVPLGHLEEVGYQARAILIDYQAKFLIPSNIT